MQFDVWRSRPSFQTFTLSLPISAMYDPGEVLNTGNFPLLSLLQQTAALAA
jgi:hypothetical protein